MGRDGAIISCPAPPRMQGRGMESWPRPAPGDAGPRPGNGPGTSISGPGRGAATGPHLFSRGPAFSLRCTAFFRCTAQGLAFRYSTQTFLGSPRFVTVHRLYLVHRPGPHFSSKSPRTLHCLGPWFCCTPPSDLFEPVYSL